MRTALAVSRVCTLQAESETTGETCLRTIRLSFVQLHAVQHTRLHTAQFSHDC